MTRSRHWCDLFSKASQYPARDAKVVSTSCLGNRATLWLTAQIDLEGRNVSLFDLPKLHLIHGMGDEDFDQQLVARFDCQYVRLYTTASMGAEWFFKVNLVESDGLTLDDGLCETAMFHDEFRQKKASAASQALLSENV